MKTNMLFGSAKMLLAGSGIYVCMAACSVAGSQAKVADKTGPQGAPDNSQQSQTDSSIAQQAADAAQEFADALTSPVDDAQAEVPDSSAPAPVLTSAMSGSRLKRKVRTGDDGSRLVNTTTFFDSAIGQDCEYMRLSDGDLHCVPVSAKSEETIPVLGFSYYADYNCTTKLAPFVKVTSCELSSTAGIVSTPMATPGCSSGRPYKDLYSVGAQITEVYMLGGNGCNNNNLYSEISQNGKYQLRVAGAPIAPSTYVRAVESVE